MNYEIFDGHDNGSGWVQPAQPWELDCFESMLSVMTFTEVLEWAIEGATETDYIVVQQYDADDNVLREESAAVAR
jgi:hypothetical protein